MANNGSGESIMSEVHTSSDMFIPKGNVSFTYRLLSITSFSLLVGKIKSNVCTNFYPFCQEFPIKTSYIFSKMIVSNIHILYFYVIFHEAMFLFLG
jgi:hypothetical protein